MINKPLLTDYCNDFGIILSPEMLDKLDLYAYLLVEENRKYNLTAITDPNEIIIKHFLDSLSAVPILNELFGAMDCYKAVDIGSGAGFPGAVLAIVDSKMSLTVIDSSQKRIDFLSMLSERLELDIQCIHSRAEDSAHNPLYREAFDVSFSRAVAQLPVLAEYCIPFLQVNGYFIAYKGKNADEEMLTSQNAFSVLNSSFIKAPTFVLPDGSVRSLCVYKKMASNDLKYPRRPSKITKSPL